MNPGELNNFKATSALQRSETHSCQQNMIPFICSEKICSHAIRDILRLSIITCFGKRYRKHWFSVDWDVLAKSSPQGLKYRSVSCVYKNWGFLQNSTWMSPYGSSWRGRTTLTEDNALKRKITSH